MREMEIELGLAIKGYLGEPARSERIVNFTHIGCLSPQKGRLPFASVLPGFALLSPGKPGW
jgi:hypothetical protein